MSKSFLYLEYIWLDGNNPQHLRSKTKIINRKGKFSGPIDEVCDHLKKNIEDLPIWNFDGSSTNQATTKDSELLLKPVNVFIDPFKKNGILVMCEVLYTNMVEHKTNKRYKLIRTVDQIDKDSMFGWEQEYIIFDKKTNHPIGWENTKEGYDMREQGDFYCAVGSKNVAGREFVYEHTELCHKAGLKVSGINFEVLLGQAEYQIGPVDAVDGSDQLWISRYILERLSEKYNYYIELDPKPFKGDKYNGSGMHVNFSTKEMRTDMKNKKKLVLEACEKLGKLTKEHIKVYGINNEHRLTGSNETCSINEFRYGIGDRTASIRIPSSINDLKSQGYFEDRRPASNGDPYQIAERMIRTICNDMTNKKLEDIVEIEEGSTR